MQPANKTNPYMRPWLKLLGVAILLYSHIAGLLIEVPRLNIVNETIRATYFHVPMWFGMVFLFSLSLYHSILHLRGQSFVSDRLDASLMQQAPSLHSDFKAEAFAHTGLAFGLLGIFTGMVWANYTWGSPWHGDPKQNGAAVAVLVYLAYFVLRGSLENQEQRARLSAVYNIFAFAAMIPLIFIIPRLTDSLHPGSGGNPGFNVYDLDSRMRLVFYPAIAGWFIIGFWIASTRIRYKILFEQFSELEHEKHS